jgi:hypothetical protein
MARAYEQLLVSRDYAMVCQTVGIQQLVLRELESMARRMGDMAAAEAHHSQLMEIESSMPAVGPVAERFAWMRTAQNAVPEILLPSDNDLIMRY